MGNMKILAIAPHTDDIEWSCGGSIARFIEEGNMVSYISFSFCEESILEGFPKNSTRVELQKSMECLGIDKTNVISYNYPVRIFNEYRQDILEKLVKLDRNINPDLVFIPSSFDVHQDHRVIYEEGIRAFKNTSNILGYEVPRNNLSFPSNFFIKLNSNHVDKKVRAISCYKSQICKDGYDLSQRESLMMYRGLQARCEYAEAFEVIKWIM